MDPDQLLQSLALALDVPKLRFDGNGCARLAIDGAPALNFERDASGAIHLYSVLGPIPPEGREALYGQMLEGNLFGASTAGASLALDVAHSEIVLCRTFVCELTSAQGFVSQIESFVAAAEDWVGRLAGPPADAPVAAAQVTDPFAQHLMRL